MGRVLWLGIKMVFTCEQSRCPFWRWLSFLYLCFQAEEEARRNRLMRDMAQLRLQVFNIIILTWLFSFSPAVLIQSSLPRNYIKYLPFLLSLISTFIWIFAAVKNNICKGGISFCWHQHDPAQSTLAKIVLWTQEPRDTHISVTIKPTFISRGGLG